jgi:aminomethyltransferase
MLKRTALIEEHKTLGGRLVDFGGWELPVQYTGVIDEHVACRTAAGLFDVSHMGEVLVRGKDAEAYLNYLVTNDVTKIQNGQAQYTVMCREDGGIVDDLIIYRKSSTDYLVVVNASNTDKDFAWMKQVYTQASKKFGWVADLTNASSEFTQIAIQGPKAVEILKKLTHVNLDAIKTYWFCEGDLNCGVSAIIARTGYTGEDGFELYVPWNQGPVVWKALMELGAPLGLKPCGLGARDTLRLEMKYPLYGNELTDETHPLETGLAWVTKLDKSDFVGKSAIVAAKSAGIKRALVGLKLKERGIARSGYDVYSSDGKKVIGKVTSGSQSPMTKESIAVSFLQLGFHEIGSPVLVEIRGAKVAAEVVKTPFYIREKKS